MVHQRECLYAQNCYYKELKPKNLSLYAKLQEFARPVGDLSCIGTKEKVPLLEAYRKIATFWEE